MTPPLPPGVEGHPVAPDIHTGCPEPDRDGWTDAADEAVRRALEVAVTGLRKMRDYYQDGAAPTVNTYVVGRDLSVLLEKIRAAR